ncbi:serine/threonine protein phosphatase 2A 57 kDa regulatory subunit B beta isoform [Tritrichomonas foetus]|uniref:Serine/threonine protein phosphatase 2A 57 kDa regulatory subunit B beta isoform n=1 Tax=Tritrichomonas foetus TaxID=1144522 RepID=A0A1J4KRJ4_9EUKA|nr:serine/threonine protein phosphatase 2A 57 kDa regulatory subunit B beta isoform [Tritrichomonas foetus]|eukprot:OHT13706.1 serine/threonine protein phosphatase 2A 57 kDa regulatory subunit B beta isoform [Tritrichomonas foetus]
MALSRGMRGSSALNVNPLKPSTQGPKAQYMSIHRAVLAPLDPPPVSHSDEEAVNGQIYGENRESLGSTQPRAPAPLSLINKPGKAIMLRPNSNISHSTAVFNVGQKKTEEFTPSNLPKLRSNALNNYMSTPKFNIPEPNNQTSMLDNNGNPIYYQNKYNHNNGGRSQSAKHDSLDNVDFGKTVIPFSRITIGFALNGPARQGAGNSDIPIIDSEVPSVIRIASAIDVASGDVKFNQLPPLPSINDPSFDEILYQKAVICANVLDFTALNEQIPEKETKARTMCEFIELFENSRDISKLSEKNQKIIFQMLQRNIFQQDPIFPSKIMLVDLGLSIVEPSWPHMFYCYQILNRFIQIFPSSPLITLETAKTAIHLTQLADTNERMQLVAFLRTFYDVRQDNRVEIIKMVRNKLIELINGIATPYCAMPLIIYITHMYTRSPPTMLTEFIKTIRYAVIPLVGLPWLPLYHQNLKQLLATVLTNNSYFADDFLRRIELMWPLADANKQTCFLSLFITIWDKMDPTAFKQMASRVFTFLAECVESPYAKVCAAALDIWNNVQESSWIGLNSRAAIHAMYESVQGVIEKYWLKSNVEKASHALTEMCRINKHSYHKMKTYIKQLKAQRYKPRIPNDTQRGWAAIAKLAAKNGEEFDLNEKLKLFHTKFHNEKKPTLAVSRFMPVLEKHKRENKEGDDKK